MTNTPIYTAQPNKKTINALKIASIILLVLGIIFVPRQEFYFEGFQELIDNKLVAYLLSISLVILPFGFAIFSFLYSNSMSKHCINLYSNRVCGYGFVTKARLVYFDLKKEQISNIYTENNNIVCINASGVVYRVEVSDPQLFLEVYRNHAND